MQELIFTNKSHRKVIRIPEDSPDLAEFLGIIIGDGGINNNWQLTISLNSIEDAEYSTYIKALFTKLFNLNVSIRKRPNQNTMIIVASSVNLLDFLIKKGAVKGNKIVQNIDMPEWVKNSDEYERLFVRGLMDTDGGLYSHKHTVKGKEYNNLGLCFTSYSKSLINSVSGILTKNNVMPHINDDGKRIYLYSVKEVENT